MLGVTDRREIEVTFGKILFIYFYVSGAVRGTKMYKSDIQTNNANI